MIKNKGKNEISKGESKVHQLIASFGSVKKNEGGGTSRGRGEVIDVEKTFVARTQR